MGVPKFYRWLSERYPLINQVVDETFKPNFDCMYLDMNGIIHGATHGDDVNLAEGFDAAAVMLRVFNYIDHIVRLAQPRKVLYMALDGVAPRAKMNQQRARRFRSAKDAKIMREEMIANGEMDADTVVFDSNAITPGTDFMAFLTPHLKYFIAKKMTEDDLWRNIQVIYSGHEVPGEGEHKIMDYIRAMKMQPGYNPNTTHCVYGLDADLIFLSLVSHEPHVCLLREEVTFGPVRKDKHASMRKTVVEDGNFQLLHIAILREYWEMEFYNPNMKAPFDFERLVDDLVLLCMLVGNDFLPNTPSMDISEGAFDVMFDLYRDMQPRMSDYVTDGKGMINFDVFQMILHRLSELEMEVLETRASSEMKNIKRNMRHADPRRKHDLKNAIGEIEDAIASFDGSEDLYRNTYYISKWDADMVSMESRRELCKDYLEALMWVLQYYYQGVCSWEWYYGHYYAPLMTDLAHFSLKELASEIHFELGSPFRPVEQLLSVLPPESAELVPLPYRLLMTDPSSPLLDFYPTEFHEDPNGKRAPWEAVVLIPFVDEKRLLEAICQGESHAGVPPAVAERNKRGSDLLFYIPKGNVLVEPFRYPSSLPGVFKDISECAVVIEKLQLPSIPGDGKFVPRPCAGAIVPYPSYPWARSLPIAASVDPLASVNVFGRPSAKETIAVSLQERPSTETLEQHATDLLGELVYINWPYFTLSVVNKVATADHDAVLDKDGETVVLRKVTRTESSDFVKAVNKCRVEWKSSRAVDIGHVTFMVSVAPLDRLERDSFGALKRRFGDDIVYPLNLVVEYSKIPVDTRFVEQPASMQPMREQFPRGSHAMITDSRNEMLFGMSGTVQGYTKQNEVKIALNVGGADPSESIQNIMKTYGREQSSEKWVSSFKIARMLDISSSVLGKVTSSVVFKPGFVNVGLGFTFKKKGLVVPGMSRCVTEQGSETWQLSTAAVQVLREYQKQFPHIFSLIQRDSSAKEYKAQDLFPGKSFGAKDKKDLAAEYLEKAKAWIKAQSSSQIPLCPKDSDVLPNNVIATIESSVSPGESASRTKKLNVSPSALYAESQMFQWSPTEKQSLQLGHRVAFLGGLKGIPFGLRGTVIGVHQAYAESPASVDVLFDEPVIGGTTLAGRCRLSRGVTLEPKCLLHLGVAQMHGTSKASRAKKAAAKKPTKRTSKVSTKPKKPSNDDIVMTDTPPARTPASEEVLAKFWSQLNLKK